MCDSFSDSLSSFDESEVDSAQSEVEESSSSLTSNSSRSTATMRIFLQSHELLETLEVPGDIDQDYEDILRRNIRLWKMSFQKHPSVQEEVDVWF
uniref:Uncharacterized protein n=1 Tax=Arion vulgaris TaxID=1028688 RepID=A0A0B6ZE85_9EUPU